MQVVKNLLANAENIKRHKFDPWVRKVPWRREWQPTPVFLLGESHGRGVCEATVYRVTQSQKLLKQLSMHHA